MVEWTFCEEPAGWSCASSVSRDHDSRSCSRSTERDWMPDANRFARNDHRFLRRCRFSHRPHCTLLRTTNGQGLRRRSRASSVLLARASRNLPARPVTSSTAILAVGLAGILPAKKSVNQARRPVALTGKMPVLLFLADLCRQKPKKFSLLGFRIHLDQRHASLGQFERRPR